MGMKAMRHFLVLKMQIEPVDRNDNN